MSIDGGMVPKSVESKTMKFLFLGGPPRSGTTALVQLLNQHPQIALGVERYKYVYGDKSRWDEIGPPLYLRPRFFDLQATDTNISLGNAKNNAYGLNGRQLLEAKFDAAQYHGDKLPSIIKFADLLNQRLGACKFIIIFRDIERMCSSWNVRAQRPADSWPAENDFRQAVSNYNFNVANALQHHRTDAERFLLVSYEKLFGRDGQACLTDLLARLDLDPAPVILDYLAANQQNYREINKKPLLELAGQNDFIQKNLNWRDVGELAARSI